PRFQSQRTGARIRRTTVGPQRRAASRNRLMGSRWQWRVRAPEAEEWFRLSDRQDSTAQHRSPTRRRVPLRLTPACVRRKRPQSSRCHCSDSLRQPMQAPVPAIQSWDREWRTGWCELPRRCRLRLRPDSTASERVGGARPACDGSSEPEDGRESPGPNAVSRTIASEVSVPCLKVRWLIQHCTAGANPICNPFDHFFRSHRGTSEKTTRLVDVAQQGAGTFRGGNKGGFDAKMVAKFEREFPHRKRLGSRDVNDHGWRLAVGE